MSHTQAFVTTPEQRPSPLDVVGIAITVLAPNTRTGSYEITLQEGPEGVGPPPHSHPWDESFYVTRGSVLFSAGGIDHMVGPGTLVHVPAAPCTRFDSARAVAAWSSSAVPAGRRRACSARWPRRFPKGRPTCQSCWR